MSNPSQESFDFTAASAGATADLTAANAAASEAPPPAPAEEPSPETPAEAPEPEVETPPVTPPEDTVEVTAAGQRIRVTRDELIKGYQRDVDYRHKTMALAEERRQLNYERQALQQDLQQKLGQVEAVLGDPAKLAQLAQMRAQQIGLPENPDEIVTAAQAQAMIKAHLQQQAQAFQQQLAATRFETEKQQYEREYTTELNAITSDILKQYPILTEAGDDIGLLMLKDARDANPQTIDDVKTAMLESAKRRATRLEKRVQDAQKMAVVRQAKVSRASIEPPGAQAPVTAPRPAGRPARIGDADLTAQAIADFVSGGKK